MRAEALTYIDLQHISPAKGLLWSMVRGVEEQIWPEGEVARIPSTETAGGGTWEGGT